MMLNIDPKIKKIAVSVILIIVSISFVRSNFTMLGSNKRLTVLKEEVELLENTKVELEESIEYRKSPEYVEEIARNELNLVRPGEEIYVVKGLEEDGSGRVLGEVFEDGGKNDDYKDEVWYMWYRLFVGN